ncbi:phosphoenolpyruvate-protein phosphotransferase [Spirochaetia bacterium]|nr:phosphoenolpyruvate-protein phosphotransferase [Spirochaetia bacterium]
MRYPSIEVKKLTGIPASPGIVTGKTFLYLEDDFPEIPHYFIPKTMVETEWKRFEKAVGEATEEIRGLRDQAAKEATTAAAKEQAKILEAHMMMLEDPDFQDQLKARLSSSLQNIEWVVWDISRELTGKLLASPDPLFRERAADISDVSNRILAKLLSLKKRFSLADISEDVILVVHDLLPSDVLSLNRDHVKGLAMDMGGRTSHTAILARAFGIPAVLGLSSISREVENGEALVVDGDSGTVIIKPDKAAWQRYEESLSKFQKREKKFLSLRELPAETKDGRHITLKANIEVPEEADQAIRYGAEGIGLYRSEFFFLTPGESADEERQYLAYTQVLKTMGGLPVTIRTMDMGGDKVLPEHQVSGEKNPLLGWRAIRFSLALPEIFKTQLRAILRAGVNGNVKIMFPMISGIEELEAALKILDEVRAEGRAAGHAAGQPTGRSKKQPYAKNIEVGAMIEIPSAAMTADILAKKADFFSLGTNDLIQYSLAVDRGNERVNYLAQPLHPAMLRLIKNTIDAAHHQGIIAAMCGEMAGDPSMTALLLGLGLDEFSMNASAIPSVKEVIRRVDQQSCQALAREALSCSSYQQVVKLVK